MKTIHRAFTAFFCKANKGLITLTFALLLLQTNALGQTFDFPSSLYVDSLSLQAIVATSGADTITVQQGDYSVMSNATTGPNFTIKSLVALTSFKVNVESADVGQKQKFTYMIVYRTYGVLTPHPTSPTYTSLSPLDTLIVSYDRDSLRLINDRSVKITGQKYHRLKIIIQNVLEIPTSGAPIVLIPSAASTVPSFVKVYGEIYAQKFSTYASLAMPSVSMTNNINTSGTIRLSWTSTVKPAGYEIEWAYVNPGGTGPDFRNNATRVFTNNTIFDIPVAQKEGTIYYRARMVRPTTADLQARTYGAWTSAVSVSIANSAHDDLNWDLKMNFVEDGKYKQIMTYYDGLLKSKQVQTRFNTKPQQTIIAQSLYDYQGRAVINSLPIPVSGVQKFSYASNFLHPASSSEYAKSSYDAIPNPNLCPPREFPIDPLEPGISSNLYFSRLNANKTGRNAFIPDAENYPLVRKLFAAENNDKVLFEGQAGSALQYGNGRQTEYLYGSPLQAELNKYFGQDIGKANYYRKMITTDSHDQDMFSITDNDGKIVASGLINTPDTNSLALSIRNQPLNKTFRSNLLPSPQIRLDENWRNNGSYFVEIATNYSFEYKIDYAPFKPCSTISVGLLPKVYYSYEVIDPCDSVVLQRSGVLGGIGTTSAPTVTYSNTAGVFLRKGNHVWNKYSYITLDDLTASVDQYLETTGGCYKTFNQYLKQEFVNSQFPCPSNNDPCASMREVMIKEMYPRAKYGQYNQTSTKQFVSGVPNSIFHGGYNGMDQYRYRYQSDGLPDIVIFKGQQYNLKTLGPQQLIDVFNDSIGAALLPLHPDYCKLLMCAQINNPYPKIISTVKKPADYYTETDMYGVVSINAIVNRDPLNSVLLTPNELLRTIGDSFRIDSMAFKKTICGSELGIIESVCSDIYATKTPADIITYPAYMREEYFKNLVELYVSNREKRLGEKLQQLASTCGPCSNERFTNPGEDNSFALEDDNTFLIKGMDSISSNAHLPLTSSFSTFVTPGPTFNADTLNKLKNFDNSIHCTELVEYITGSLVNCNVTQAKLNELRDTLTKRFCINNNSITSLSDDSLTSIMTSVGIASNDLCNSGLVDLRRITRGSGDFVSLGLLHYSPSYYSDLLNFLQNNNILGFIAGGSSTMNVSLALCDAKPFEQSLAKQLGGIPDPINCSSVLTVQLVKTNLGSSNTVQLAFVNGGSQLKYFLYPAVNGEYNALNSSFGQPVISSPQNYKLTSLFNMYGFDKLSGSFANRNTTMLVFKGTQSSVQKNFAYFLSAFNEQSDYNLMEKDRKEYLNGVSCSEFIPMAKQAVAMAQQLNIKANHPYFEKFFTNVVNYKNNVNFDFKNYDDALKTCGVSDSIIIQKNVAHFRIKLPGSTTLSTIQKYIDSLRVYDTVGIADVQAYRINSFKYLLINITESNGKTLLGAKKQIQQRLPAGGLVEYLPSLQKDTLAQLLSSSLDSINTAALSTAFPTATINVAAVDSIYYFIPGYSVFKSTGKFITISKSIPVNYTYNHTVDDIYKFVSNNAAMTSIFSHAESAVSDQYYDWQMIAWRDYIHTLNPSNHNVVAKGAKPDKFNTLSATAGPYSFASSRFSYNNQRSPFYLNNLYIDHDPNGNTDYSYIKQMLQTVETAHFPQSIFHPHATSSPLMLSIGGYSTETRAYICGDTTQFWINHFDKNDNMINVFVKLPDYLMLPRNLYRIVTINKGFERDSVTFLDLVFAAQQGVKKDTIQCIGYTNKKIGGNYTIPSAFLSSHSQFEMLLKKFENCETRKIQDLYPQARIKFNQYKDSARGEIVVQFRKHVIDNLKESLIVIGADIKHGVTLYYYDAAGNLIKTVSPAGVNELNVSGVLNDTINAKRARHEMTSPEIPAHGKITTYRYNAQNKVVQTQSPDAGLATSKYDMMGRIVISQNAKQSPLNEYTYFLYDNLSRVIETGLVTTTTPWPSTFFTQPSSAINAHIKGLYRREVTVTNYDLPSYTVSGVFATLPTQDNLKNRVSSTKYFVALGSGVDAGADLNYNSAIHYSYDVSGNVKTLIHDLKYVADAFMRFKRVDYEYDLYSGKVLMASYNRGFPDQFYQKYAYDADNRIVEVQTSNNGLKWDRDAYYEYYDHGPLARTEIGEQRVQGIDYAYTINGWLKVTNGFQNGPQSDIGKDGDVNKVVPKDVFSQRIDYFTGDYKAIDDSNYFKKLPAVTKSLYNGNIAGIATSLAPFSNLLANYFYDPLQRIDSVSYNKYDYNYTTAVLNNNSMLDYRSKYKYDADGNLLKLTRQGATINAAFNPPTYANVERAMMDSFTYRYYPGTNKLRNLVDTATASYTIDIPMYKDTVPNRYTYDANGNMITDVGNGLSNIEWNKMGKLASLQRADNSRMYFTYDPMGNRLAKELVTYPATDKVSRHKTIYVRDATGNTLAVYEDEKDLDLERVSWFNIRDYLVDHVRLDDGTMPTVFARPLAEKLVEAYQLNGASLAQVAMAVPEMTGYAADQNMLQQLVSSLNHPQALSFVQSIPAITTHTLSSVEGEPTVPAPVLSTYLQPLMLSPAAELEDLQTQLFSTLKLNDEMLYYNMVQTVPVSQQEKDQFPANPAMLNAFKNLPVGEKLQITNMLSQSLTMGSQQVLPSVATILSSAYSSSNTYGNFVQDIPGNEYIYEQLKQDANNYIAYQYTQSGLPPQQVQSQFSSNGVLAGVVGNGLQPDVEALTGVLTYNMADVISLAGSGGHTATLVQGVKDVIAYTGTLDILHSWFRVTEVLKNQKLHLAEHHIYGSSRLGMQKYLPEELKYHYAVGQNGAVTVENLTGNRPWYSRYGNDLFSATLYNNNLSVANHTSTGTAVNVHLLGNRHYELTNHLGNVQATVLDRTTPILHQSGYPVLGYKADISNAWDYYPFGMYMPGRYISDTSSKCVTINTTVLVPTTTKVWVGPAIGQGPWVIAWPWGHPDMIPVHQLTPASSFALEKLYLYHYLPAQEHPGGWVINATPQGQGTNYQINLGNEPSGVSAFLLLHPPSGSSMDIGFDMGLSEDYQAQVRVRQYLGSGSEYEEALGWTPVQMGGPQQYNIQLNQAAIAAGGKTMMELRFTKLDGGTFAQTAVAQLWSPWKYVTTYTPESRIARVCDGQENYRYGYNGKEKDNETKGPGNGLDFGARIFDSRLSRFLSIDPLTMKYPKYSPYLYGGNNPIYYVDKNGEHQYEYYLTIKNDGSTVMRQVYHNDNWFGIMDWKRVKVFDENGKKLGTYMFTPFGTNGDNSSTKPMGGGSNHLDQFKSFRENPVAAMASGQFTTEETIIKQTIRDIALTMLIGRAMKMSAPSTGTTQNMQGSKFAQTSIRGNRTFSPEGQNKYTQVAGRSINTVEDLTAAIKSNAVSPKDIPVDYVMMNGERVILNTRTSTALTNAGVPMSEWHGIDRTGQAVPGMNGTTFDQLGQQQIQNNKLDVNNLPTQPPK